MKHWIYEKLLFWSILMIVLWCKKQVSYQYVSSLLLNSNISNWIELITACNLVSQNVAAIFGPNSSRASGENNKFYVQFSNRLKIVLLIRYRGFDMQAIANSTFYSELAANRCGLLQRYGFVHPKPFPTSKHLYECIVWNRQKLSMADICSDLWQQRKFVEVSEYFLNDNGYKYYGQTKNNLLQNPEWFKWLPTSFEKYFENGNQSDVDWLFVGQYIVIAPTKLKS